MSKIMKECPADEAVEATFVAKAMTDLQGQPVAPDLLKTRLSQYLGMLRGMHLWFHGAHHATRGNAFGGDHVDIFGRIYTAIEGEMDGAIEKAVGVTDDAGLACPMHITKNALTVMGNYPSPPALSPLAIAAVGLEMEKNYLEVVEQMFAELEQHGSLSLGLNDFLAASANLHESHIYLLQQRVKSTFED
jgi:hypothetical protein